MGGNAHLLLIQKSLYREYMPPLGLQPEHITVFQINSSFMIRADVMIHLTYWLLQCISGLDLWTKLVVSLERRKPRSYPLGSLYILVSSIRRDTLNWFPVVRNIPGKHASDSAHYSNRAGHRSAVYHVTDMCRAPIISLHQVNVC